MGTSQGELLSEAVFARGKVCIAYLAFQLSGLAVITVKIRLWGAAGRAGVIITVRQSRLSSKVRAIVPVPQSHFDFACSLWTY